MSQKPLNEDKVDWVKETSKGLTYFSKHGVSIDKIDNLIEGLYKKILKKKKGLEDLEEAVEEIGDGIVELTHTSFDKNPFGNCSMLFIIQHYTYFRVFSCRKPQKMLLCMLWTGKNSKRLFLSDCLRSSLFCRCLFSFPTLPSSYSP